MNKSSFEEEINCSGRLVYKNSGRSMLPLIRQHKDLLVIEKVEARLKKYDIPLYKTLEGRYNLHRIVKVKKDDYVVCGDNCKAKEYGIKDSQIIGVLKEIVRDGKTINVQSVPCRIYARIWCGLYPVRILSYKVYYFLRRRCK